LAAQGPIRPRYSAPRLRLYPDVPLPTHCPRRHPPGKLGFAPAGGSLWLQVLAPARHRPRGCGRPVWRLGQALLRRSRVRDCLGDGPVTRRRRRSRAGLV
jgi:hypothetical protein